jgi:hypothetical protein
MRLKEEFTGSFFCTALSAFRECLVSTMRQISSESFTAQLNLEDGLANGMRILKMAEESPKWHRGSIL